MGCSQSRPEDIITPFYGGRYEPMTYDPSRKYQISPPEPEKKKLKKRAEAYGGPPPNAIIGRQSSYAYDQRADFRRSRFVMDGAWNRGATR